MVPVENEPFNPPNEHKCRNRAPEHYVVTWIGNNASETWRTGAEKGGSAGYNISKLTISPPRKEHEVGWRVVQEKRRNRHGRRKSLCEIRTGCEWSRKSSPGRKWGKGKAQAKERKARAKTGSKTRGPREGPKGKTNSGEL